jgi:hypothetical protein
MRDWQRKRCRTGSDPQETHTLPETSDQRCQAKRESL